MTPPESGGAAGARHRERSASTAPRILVIEVVDAVGADAEDGRARAGWLKAAGARARWAAWVPEGRAPRADLRECSGILTAGPSNVRRLRDLVEGEACDLVLVASSAPGGGPVARALAGGRPVRWWPSGFPSRASGSPFVRLRGLGRPRGEAAPWDGGAQEALDPLAWSALERQEAERRTLPLWDGDFVLAPEGLGGARGRAVVEAFAEVAPSFSAVDLVAWGHPHPIPTRHARTLEIETRVHHAGEVPRAAEAAWWAHASAAVLTGEGAVSGGMVLRAIHRGCPLLWVAPPAASAARALADQGCAFVTEADPRSIARDLERVLERGPEVEETIDRARRLAAAHGTVQIVARCARALGDPKPVRRAA